MHLKMENLLDDLEKAELESTEGIITTQMYSQMLAIYLLQNELCHAKYLWKRIPPNIKNNSIDIKNIWIVAQKMWQRDWHAVHLALNVNWDKNVVDIMNALKERVQERAVTLIGEAYSSVDISTLCKMTGMTCDDSHQIASKKKWSITGSVVKPHKICKLPNLNTPEEEVTEDQLFKLTQFVSFLEN
ncbi:COP9 signalosome complex subunit 8 [Phymastichus coffea]|uniref:COP9 signalosome complex subunit 8 n=1 Tax=Phymastichus coffea TaxID=108790 RepID=UPI00273AA28D|nr:COP9 signalosome complex subunit 8 [Phymastichus coffea]